MDAELYETYGVDIDAQEALARSIACFAVSLELVDAYPKFGTPQSFKHIAAAVCLKEIERDSGGFLRPL